ncbi:MAG: transcriptional repressor NrdR [Clostridia bacterium]|nr:transcriptional repressor NrdR [Clostridia bacterium]
MKCPNCGCTESKVLDSRPAEDFQAIRRRRECEECQKRFTTYERMETIPLVVVKRDRRRETFDRNKLIGSMLRACEKRSVSMAQITEAADKVEQSLTASLKTEVTSAEIGELVMNELKKIDDVSYVRFASVYRQFKDLNTFMEELQRLLNEEKKK